MKELKPQPEYITPQEAAALLRLDVRTVYSRLRASQLPGRQLTKRGAWRISRSALLAQISGLPNGDPSTARKRGHQ